MPSTTSVWVFLNVYSVCDSMGMRCCWFIYWFILTCAINQSKFECFTVISVCSGIFKITLLVLKGEQYHWLMCMTYSMIPPIRCWIKHIHLTAEVCHFAKLGPISPLWILCMYVNQNPNLNWIYYISAFLKYCHVSWAFLWAVYMNKLTEVELSFDKMFRRRLSW